MKKRNLRIIIILLTCLIIVTFVLIITLSKVKSQTEKTVIQVQLDEQTTQKMRDAEDEAKKEKLSKLSETKRIEYYATEFIKALENRQCKTAYKMLNDDFKKNYFDTYESFEAYVKKYIPKNIGTKYNNIERLGEIYVIEADIADVLASDNPNNYSCYIVIKENDYNDFELSFSVDSAMENIDGEDTEE